MGEASAETFGRGSVEVVQRVVNAARIEVGMQAHDLVGPAPNGLIGDHVIGASQRLVLKQRVDGEALSTISPSGVRHDTGL